MTRNNKLDCYRSVDSVTDVILIAQHRYLVEHYTRYGEGQWLLTAAVDPAASIDVESIGCTLALGDVYDGVEWPEDSGVEPPE